MIGAAIIVFRETLEAALILGIVAAATRALPGRGRWLAGGVGAGVLGAVLVASLMRTIADLADGVGQELLNAGVLLLAAAMLAWHVIWMARHGRRMAQEVHALGAEVQAGAREMSAVAVVVALAVLREGAETVLFLYGLLAGGGETPMQVAGGGALGLLAGALAGVGLYAGFVRIPTRVFFAATGGFIVLLAAAMAGQAARFLVQADWLPSLATPLWDSSWLLGDDALAGRVLHTLVGYEAMPLGMQVLVQVGTVVAILVGMRLTRVPAGAPRAPSAVPATH